jgi:uncharacterized protein YPO0396
VNTGRTFPTGVGAEADGVAASTMYQLHDGEFDLDELEAWAARRFDTRWFKQTAYPHAFYPQGQQHYLRELSKRIRLGTSQTALSLLGKAKAMKNVGDLNLFVRENMLDEPDTWAAAERALAAFTPLNNAYNTAKRARDQEHVLHELPAAWAAYTAADEAGERAAALQGASVDRYVRSLLLAELDRELATLDARTTELDAALAGAQKRRDQAHEHYRTLDRELAAKTADIRALEAGVKEREADAALAQSRHDQYRGLVTQLEDRCPTNEIEFAALRRRLPQLASDAAADVTRLSPEAHDAIAKHVNAKNTLRAREEEGEQAPPRLSSPGPTEVDRLLALGAQRADIGQGQVPWVVLSNPEGNEFCLLEPRERS